MNVNTRKQSACGNEGEIRRGKEVVVDMSVGGRQAAFMKPKLFSSFQTRF